MNGNLPVGAVSPLSLSVPGYSTRAPAPPASARSFGAVLAGSPAPGPLPGRRATRLSGSPQSSMLIVATHARVTQSSSAGSKSAVGRARTTTVLL